MIFGIRNNRVPEAVTIRELVDWIIADCPMIDLVTSGIIADGYKLITIAQKRMRDKNLFNAFILASFLRSNNY